MLSAGTEVVPAGGKNAVASQARIKAGVTLGHVTVKAGLWGSAERSHLGRVPFFPNSRSFTQFDT